MKLQLRLFFIFTAFSIAASGQLKVTVLDKKDIPPDVKVNGKIVYAANYHDSLGDHILIASETGETKTKNAEDENRDAVLYAYHYLVLADSLKMQWKLTDYVKECAVDIVTGFIKNAFSITDLNKDGKAECWIMYKLACRSDVSPATMKIIMYENDQKSAVRGSNKVKASETSFIGGEYSFDESFKKGPAVFRAYATELWKKNMVETWE